MYLDQGDPSEKCGELNFGLEYDFATQTLKLKINQVSTNSYFWYKQKGKNGGNSILTYSIKGKACNKLSDFGIIINISHKSLRSRNS